MHIAFFEIQKWEEESLKKRFEGHQLSFFERTIEAGDLETLQECEVLSVFIYSQVTAEVIEKLSKLKLIVTRSTGFDHINIEAAKAKNIIVSNVPSYGENTVAEHTFALILALSRNVHKSHVRRLTGDFAIEGLQGFDLKGKTLGVIGAGKIGLHVIKIAKGFGMEVLAYDAFENRFLSEVLDFQYVPLHQLLERADIISLHTPYTKETHHLINQQNINLLKHGSILINTARGELVETDALISGLDQGILAGVGLDVLEGELLVREEKELLEGHTNSDELQTLAKDHALLSRDNVVYTPHIAFYSREALERILSTTIDNIECYAIGHCKNIVAGDKN
ncbi:MAG: hydroxyacid dehydrogenase [Candidatus Moraniibacteriota bacterium]|nr:MAG: hydroxyacid dehydrogenase [Candidatus Moranbacteria bacterium]